MNGTRFRLRELRGLGILAKGGQIEKIRKNSFLVRSQSEASRKHKIRFLNKRWHCDCKDFQDRGRPCKHVFAVNYLRSLPLIVLSNRNAIEKACPYCGSSDFVRNGRRHNKFGQTQLFTCNGCKRTFRDELLPKSE